jgi:hypothetical protein
MAIRKAREEVAWQKLTIQGQDLLHRIACRQTVHMGRMYPVRNDAKTHIEQWGRRKKPSEFHSLEMDG